MKYQVSDLGRTIVWWLRRSTESGKESNRERTEAVWQRATARLICVSIRILRIGFLVSEVSRALSASVDFLRYFFLKKVAKKGKRI